MLNFPGTKPQEATAKKMGKEIVYCHVCGDRILPSDFEKGRAATVLKRNYCAKCSEAVKEQANKNRATADPKKGSPVPGKIQTTRVPVSTRRQKAPQAKSNRPALITIGIIAGALLLLILVILVLSRPRS